MGKVIFAISDKGGTGRSVTCANLAYRLAVGATQARANAAGLSEPRPRKNVCYVDFDFGSPTSGTIFRIPGLERGVAKNGVHDVLLGRSQLDDLARIDVWPTMADSPGRVGRLVHVPGSEGGGEFQASQSVMQICADLFSTLAAEFDIVIVDLSAGRSHAVRMAGSAMRDRVVDGCWLLHHRWTRQHILAARGLLQALTGESVLQDRDQDDVHIVRTATLDIKTLQRPNSEVTEEFRTWLTEVNNRLEELAGESHLGRSRRLENIPLEPLLQWREQVISDDDVFERKIARPATVDSFDRLASKVTSSSFWGQP